MTLKDETRGRLQTKNTYFAHLSLAFAAASLAAHFTPADRHLFAPQLVTAAILAVVAMIAAAYGWPTTDEKTAWHRAAIIVATLTLALTVGYIGLFVLALAFFGPSG